jgi:hypothetical protein
MSASARCGQHRTKVVTGSGNSVRRGVVPGRTASKARRSTSTKVIAITKDGNINIGGGVVGTHYETEREKT